MNSMDSFAVGSNDVRSNIARGDNCDVDNEEALSPEPFTYIAHELLASSQFANPHLTG